MITLKPLQTTAILALAIGNASHASVTGLRWIEVDNTVVDPSSDPIAGAAWLANPAGWRTFDLMVLGGANDRLSAFYIGDSIRPELDDYAIYTDGVVFHHSAGGDLLRPDGPIFDFAPLLQFDTFLTLGDLDEGFANAGPIGIDLTDGIAGLNGGVYTTPPYEPRFGSEGMLRVMRLTVSADFNYLGNFRAPSGVFSEAAVVFNTGLTTSFALPNFIPSPGVAGVLAIAGLVAARRRR